MPHERHPTVTAPTLPERPRVGVGVIVRRGDTVLLGRRRGPSHGEGTWQFPGGHLEFGESVEGCATREVLEETGLTIDVTGRGPWTNDHFPEVGRHYVTVFVLADARDGEPELREPDRCDEWRWCRWDAMPTPLFTPIAHLIEQGWRPGFAARP